LGSHAQFTPVIGDPVAWPEMKIDTNHHGQDQVVRVARGADRFPTSAKTIYFADFVEN
jgi:hypothetical protein